MLEYTFDNVSGTTVADTSGNNNNSTASQNISFGNGPIGHELRCNTTYIVTPSMAPIRAISLIESRVSLPPLPGCESLVAGNVRNNYANRSIALGAIPQDTSKIYLVAGGGNGNANSAMFDANCMSLSAPNHICVNYPPVVSNHGSEIEVFLGGMMLEPVFATNADRTDNEGSGQSVICAAPLSSVTNTRFHKSGGIDQVRFYSRPLEQYEITNLYNGGLGC